MLAAWQHLREAMGLPIELRTHPKCNAPQMQCSKGVTERSKVNANACCYHHPNVAQAQRKCIKGYSP